MVVTVFDVAGAGVDGLPPFVFAADELVPLDGEPGAVVPGCCVPPPLPAFAPEEEFALLVVPEGCVAGDDPLVVLVAAFEVLPLLLSPFPLELWLLLPPVPAAGLCGGAGGGFGAAGTLLLAGLVTPASSRAANGCALTFWFCADATAEGDDTAVEALGDTLGTLGTVATPGNDISNSLLATGGPSWPV